MEIITEDTNNTQISPQVTLANSKIILITARLRDNINYKPAEEILLEIISLRTGIKFEIIECDLFETNNFFGRSPVIYFNGRVIINQNIIHFLRDLITHNNNENEGDNLFFDNVISVLRDQLRFANEFYFYLKQKEKKEKNQKRKFLVSFLSKIVNRKINTTAYEHIAENILNNFSVIARQENMYLDKENKLSILIKDAYAKLNKLIKDKEENLVKLSKDEENFVEILIFSFLKEDKLLFSLGDVSRPFINYLSNRDEETLSYIATYYTKLEEKIKHNQFRKILFRDNYCVKNYSLAINPSLKKVKNIQELEVTRSFNHNLFSIGIFSITALILLYISTRK